MLPILFQSGNFYLQSYGFFLALGYLTCLLVLLKTSEIMHFDFSNLARLCFPTLIAGILGARLLFVITNFSYFSRFPQEIPALWRGGLVFYGGLFSGLGCLVYLSKKKFQSAAETLDLLAPAVAAGHAVGRLGCFAAGCCHGKYCELPWGLRFNSDLVDPVLRGLPLHPTQLYEFVFLLIISLLSYRFLIKRAFRTGGVAIFYLVSYSTARFFVEFFRGDQIRGFLFQQTISVSQAIALATVCVCLPLFFRRFRRNN